MSLRDRLKNILPSLSKAGKKTGDVEDQLLERIEQSIAGEFVDRHAYESGWLLNLLFYQGFHWMRISTYSGSLTSTDEPVRFKSNLIQGAVNHRVSKLTSNPPDWDVDSDVEDDGIQDAAKIAEMFLEYVWDKEEMPVRCKELATSFSTYGTAFLHPLWNPDAGETLDPKDFFSEDAEGNVANVDDLSGAFDGDDAMAEKWLDGDVEVRSGDVEIEVVSPFDVYFDEAAKSVSQARWAVKTTRLGIDELKAQFGDDIDVQPEPINANTGQLYKQWRERFVNSNVGLTGVSSQMENDSLEQREYWERPTTEFPNGRYAVYASKHLIHQGDNPYAHTSAEIPFVRFRDVIVPDRFWGSSTIEQAIPLQRAYNKVCSDLIKNSHDHGSNKWLVPTGAGLIPGALDRRSDEVVEYTPYGIAQGAPLKPERVYPGQVSSLYITQLQEWKERINDIFGVHDVSQGNVPSGVKSGVAIQLLQEGDDTRLGSVLQEMHGGLARFGKMVLDIARIYIDENEIRYFTSIAGDDSAAEVIEYTEQDITSKSVRVRVGSMFNRKRAARQQAAMELIQYLPPEVVGSRPEIIENAMKAAGISTEKVSTKNADENRAKYNCKMLEKGKFPQFNDYDNPDIHLSVVEGRMKRLDFDRLPPQIQEAYRQYRQMVLGAQQQAMMALQGPPAAGPPPQPGAPPEAGAPVGQEQGLGSPLQPQGLNEVEEPQVQLPIDENGL